MGWPSVSIIIRTLNEVHKLAILLHCLKSQNYHSPVEIIVVDNKSRDLTEDVAVGFKAKVVTLEREEFTYPKSLNVGAAAASNEILIFTVGHALPTSRDWLQSGMRHFTDPTVGGVYSPVIPHKSPPYRKGTLAEKLFYYPGYWKARIRGPHAVKHRGMGVLGATNCAIRRSTWEGHRFDERFECGGEDGEMAKWIQEHGLKIICDWEFAVYHSHGLRLRRLIEQVKYWSRLGQPTKFERGQLSFRKDLDFRT